MSNRTTAFYNQFYFLYPLADLFLKPQKRRLFSEVNCLPEGKLLEIGVGNGSHLRQYKKHQVTGIDTAVTMLNAGKKNCPDNVNLLVMNGEALLFDDQAFDYVVLSHVIAVVDDAAQLLQEVYRVLKPGGQVFILNHFTPDNWLRYIDSAFQPFAKLLHFKSAFHLQKINAINKFTLKEEIGFGFASYFKLLIYLK